MAFSASQNQPLDLGPYLEVKYNSYRSQQVLTEVGTSPAHVGQ